MIAAQGDLEKYNWILDNSNRGDLERALDRLTAQELKIDMRNCADNKQFQKLQKEFVILTTPKTDQKEKDETGITAAHMASTSIPGGFAFGKRLPIILPKDNKKD